MPKIAPSDHAKRQDYVRPSSRRAWLAGASLLALGAALAVPQQALAQNVTISTSQGGYVTPGNITFLTITNTGTLSGNDGLNDNNSYVIQTLTNNGLITANSQAVEVLVSIGTLTNTGAIISSNIGVAVNGTVDSLSNSGTISGASAIHVGNTRLGALRNSGTISGSNYAIYNSGTIGSGGAGATLTNTGVIAGNIFSGSLSFGGPPLFTSTTVGNNLSIAGGTGITIGTLTGYTAGTEGTITAGNVALSGNILLNDAVSIGLGTLTNSGNLSLISIVSITGNYNQGATGTLSLAPGAELVVSGAASITGGATIVSSLAAGGNYFASTYPATLIAGGANTHYAAKFIVSGLAGLDQSPFGSIAGNNLLNAVDNDYIGGTFASLVNSTVLGNGFSTNPVTTAVYVASTGRLGTLTNTGYLNGTAIGVTNNGSIGVLTNSGQINVHTQFYTVGPTGIYNSSNAVIGALTNSGTIQGSIYGIRNAGTIGGGSVAGASFTNTGTIAGGILNTGNLSIAGATVAGSFGTLTGYAAGAEGVITNTSGNVVFTGNQLLNDTINAGANTVTNSGGSLSLISIVSITGNYTQATGTLTEAAGSELVVSGAASITGGTVAAAGGFVSTGNYLAGAAGGTLVAGGAGSNYTGVTVVLSGTVTGLAVGSAVSGNNLLAGALNDYIGASTLASVNNTGSIGGVAAAVYVASTGTLTGTLSNTGTLIGTSVGVTNKGSIGALSNASGGTITGANTGIQNVIGVTIGALTNSGAISGGIGIVNALNAYIGQLTNNATIAGSIAGLNYYGIQNVGSIGSLTNNANAIVSGAEGIYNIKNITTLTNAGTIFGSIFGIDNVSPGTIGFLNNSGKITGGLSSTNPSNAAINNGGKIGTLTNSGTISGSINAIFNTSGTIGGTVAGATLTNTGVIAGSIVNTNGNLSIAGGTGTVFGTLTGYASGTQGTIANTSGNVVLSGNQVLNDFVSIASGSTLTNAGGNIALISIVSITGNYSQATGTLTVGAGAELVVSGPATISSLVVGAGTLVATGNYISGASAGTLVAGGNNSNYAGITVVGGGITGLDETGYADGHNNVVSTVTNDYVGGNDPGLITNVSLTGVTTALYVASTGTLGFLNNSGTLSGSINGLANYGSIGSINNSGTISGGIVGLFNAGSIGTIINNGLIQDVPAPAHIGLSNTGSIAVLTNNGTISGATGLSNTGSVAVFSNTGTIIGVTNAISNSGNLGTVSNSGVIAGNILNTSANDLTFAGGSGSTYGTLTGYTAGSQGTITGTTANAVFAAGQIFLNDAMNLGSHSFINSGASIQINNTIAVTGNFVQTSGTLLIGASSATSNGDIVVTGNATITGGTVSVAAVGGFTLAPAQTYTIVQARGSLSVSGLTASVTNYVPVINTITAGGYNDLILTLNTIGSTTTGNTGGGTTTGNTVTGTTGTVTGTTGTVTGTTGTTTGTTSSGGGSGSGGSTIVATLATYTALGNATGGVATGIGPALDRIAAGITPSVGVSAATSATDQQFYTSVLAPLNALPTAAAKHTAITQLSPGQLTPQAAPIAVTPALDAITEHQNTLPGATDGLGALSRGAGAGSEGQQGALWGQLLAGNATRDQGNGAAGYGATTYGVLAGADFEVTPELLAGVAIDWITSRVTGNDALTGSTTHLSSYQFEGYGSWRPDRFDGRLTVDGQLGFGENSYNQHRAISYLNLGANAHFDGQQYVASVLAGYRLDIQGPVEVAPYLRLRETHLVNGGYSETGAGLADLAVNGITTDSFTHELGVKAGMEFDTQFGKMFPAVKVGWIHDYTNGPIALTGNLLGGTVFTSATSQPGADGAALGLTLDLKRTDSFSLSIEYDGEYHKDFTSNTGLVNGTWKF